MMSCRIRDFFYRYLVNYFRWLSSGCIEQRRISREIQQGSWAVKTFEEWRQFVEEGIIDTGGIGLGRLAMSSVKKPEVLFVLGGPGSGKGTTCKDIVKKCGYVHLSAGDLLREERVNPDSEYGELIENHIRNGTIVPVEITCSLLERAMNESINPQKRFLIDGFPRNQDNVDGWNKAMADKVDLKGVVYLECSEEICTRRCLNRGLKGSGRSDDNQESLKKRHNTYINDTMPIIKYYEKLGLVYKFDSTVPPIKVLAKVYNKFNEIV